MMEQAYDVTTIQQLEKENRILRKKLERSEKNCLELEQTNQKKEFLLRQVINDLENSQKEVEEKRQLEQALLELRQTQAKLIQAEKMSSLGQLVAGVAHEINNPVNFIYGNLKYVEEYTQYLLDLVELYQQHYPYPAKVIQALIKEVDLEFLQEDLPRIVSSMQLGTQRIRGIVLSLRNFSRMDEAEFKEVDIHDGIDSTLLILQHRLKGNPECPDIEVVREYGSLPLVECYAGQLNQVFMNIVANAIDALGECNQRCSYNGEKKAKLSQIKIATSVVDGTWIRISIEDNGPGMSEAIKKQIFNPFFTTKPVGKGTGMGMSISYQIITERHHGKLECYSVPGEGTKFIIEIPIKQLGVRS